MKTAAILQQNTESKEEKTLFEFYRSNYGVELCDAFEVTNPKTVCFADKLPSRGGKFVETPVTMLEKQYGFCWTEANKVPKGVRFFYDRIRQNQSLETLTQDDATSILFKCSAANLGLVNMGPSSGCGVCAIRGFKIGDTAILYTGELLPSNEITKENSFYRIQTAERMFLTETELDLLTDAEVYKQMDKKMGITDAERYGNISRFLQHLPTQEELSEMKIPQELQAEIAIANLNPCRIKYRGSWGTSLKVVREIKPGDLVGYSYGYDYWCNLQKPLILFNKKGEPFIRMLITRSEKNHVIKFDLLPLAQRCIAAKKFDAGQYSTALMYYRGMLPKMRLDNAEAATCYYNIGSCFKKLEKWSEAAENYKKAWDIRQKISSLTPDIVARAKSAYDGCVVQLKKIENESKSSNPNFKPQ